MVIDVSIYIYVCMCVYIYICIYIYVHMYIYSLLSINNHVSSFCIQIPCFRISHEPMVQRSCGSVLRLDRGITVHVHHDERADGVLMYLHMEYGMKWDEI